MDRNLHCPPTQAGSSKSSSNRPLFPSDIKQSLALLQHFGKQVTTVGCHQCGQAVLNKFSINRHMDNWSNVNSPKHGAPITGVQCQQCQASTCVGCRKKPTPGRQRNTVGQFKLDWCCDPGRLVAIWMIASYFDEKLYETMPKEQRNQNANKPIQKGSGTGYSSGVMPSMYSPIYGMGAINFSETRIKDADPNIDRVNGDLMKLLTALLPRPDSTTNAFHKSPPPEMMPILELSFVLDACSELLRNDSIDDAVKRGAVYSATLGLVDALAKHPKTNHLVTSPRHSKKSSDGIVRLIADNGSSLFLDDPKSGKSSSVAAAMTNLVTVSDTMLQLTKTNPAAYKDDDGQRVIALSKRVADVSKRIPASRSVPEGSGTKSHQQQWEDLHKHNRVSFVQDSTITHCHVYRSEAANIGFTVPNRMRRLGQEIASMKTSLPPGIFLKVAESRPDVMKALIIGPEGTPYAKTALEFDILCPAQYPAMPPQVNCPSGGRYRLDLNPNLYPDGKVCLTLLGTFQGEPSEMWQPNISTIYQVLVSIQSMILAENPYENIPNYSGYLQGSQSRSSRAEQYNLCVEAKSIYVGLERWLAAGSLQAASFQIWHDILSVYFKSNAQAIINRLKQRAKENAGLTKFNSMYINISLTSPSGPSVDLVRSMESSFRKLGYM